MKTSSVISTESPRLAARRKRSRETGPLQSGLKASNDAEASNSHDNETHPIRDCRSLYASHMTYDCVRQNYCVPCAYKICCFDVALDKEFSRAVPNQRPEMCPRSRNLTKGRPGTFGYVSGQRVLTVGDGDFSWSLALARLGCGAGLIATSYESRDTLLSVYPGIQDTLAELETLGATVYFNVDATKIKMTMPVCKGENSMLFDRIVWNFPCEAVSKGRDGQNEQMERNKELVREFVANAKHLLCPAGQLHINHKTKPPFNQWSIEDVAVQGGSTIKGDVPLVHYYGRIAFDRCIFPPYIPRKALDRKSFPAHDACTYVFGIDKNNNPLEKAAVAPTCDSDDPPRSRGTVSNPSSLVRVDRNLISGLRRTMLRNATAKSKKKRKVARGKH